LVFVASYSLYVYSCDNLDMLPRGCCVVDSHAYVYDTLQVSYAIFQTLMDAVIYLN
jgi:hypothetical protein